MRKTIYFIFVKPLSFSGQSAASELLFNAFKKKGWNCKKILIYPLDRGQKSFVKRYINFFINMLKTVVSLKLLLFEKKAIIHLNLGQSYASFIRFFIPFCLIKLKQRSHLIISLHGHVFMEWTKDSMICKFFLWYLNTAKVVTVLGDSQKRKLLEFGLSENVVQIIPNTCEFIPINEKQLIQKHKDAPVVQLLHLSLLIESKGFPVFLEAVEYLSKIILDRRINVVLCGPVSFTTYCQRFIDEQSKSDWIISKIANINQNSNFNIVWKKGLRGNDKKNEYENSHIFVFPSSFPVETQPLVILEAMASGCAIMTTKVGEIESTIGEEESVSITSDDFKILALDMLKLIKDEEKRIAIAKAALDRYNEHYTNDRHLSYWEKIFINL